MKPRRPRMGLFFCGLPGETVMPVFRVCSGDLDVTLTRESHQDAASDAIGTLRSGNFDKLKLGLMTSVLMLGDEEEIPVFIETLYLVKLNGLNYTHAARKG